MKKVINIVLCADTRAAGASDDIDDAVNYRLSRIPRIVEMFARRLQVQERMTQQTRP